MLAVWGLPCPCPVGLAPLSVQIQALSAAPRLNREHKELCEMDWSDKVEAYNIDETCARYNNQSTEVQFHPHSTKFEERWAPVPLCTKTLSPHLYSPCPPPPIWLLGVLLAAPPAPSALSDPEALTIEPAVLLLGMAIYQDSCPSAQHHSGTRGAEGLRREMGPGVEWGAGLRHRGGR